MIHWKARVFFWGSEMDLSTEELLSAEQVSKYGYTDFLYYAILGRDTLALLTPHAAVASEGESGMVSLDQLVEVVPLLFHC
jgi:hypothetical protein